MKKILPIFLVGLLTISGFGAALVYDHTSKKMILHEEIQFSEPTIADENNYISIHVKEATSYATLPGNPILPVYTKLFTFPMGTIITDVSYTTSSEQIFELSKEILPANQLTPISQFSVQSPSKIPVKNDAVYSMIRPYPLSRLNYQVGTGLDGNNHVMLLSIQYYPLLYLPLQNILLFSSSVHLNITYELSNDSSSLYSNNSLLIITPENFTTALQPLILHKNQYGIDTIIITTEWIANHATGRDLQEQIKYTIKDVIESNGVSFVLLVGGVDIIPIRRSYVMLWDWDEEMITDLYYSDIYDKDGNFSSWDTNNNDLFGESSDLVDHYPDIHLGRLACNSLEDVNITVNKIIHYEVETYGSDWFKTMIFIGGNTFRWSPGNDGEENNQIIMEIMSQFIPEIIWTSKNNFNRWTITEAITQGAGFLDYSGHGFEHGMMTYTPTGFGKKYYFTTYIKDIKNNYKLPIMFFDACLTAKIDFILQDFLNYRQYRVFDILARLLGINTSKRLPCYAWAFVNHENGGAIATIGATRTAYGGVDNGAGKMSIEFFSAYNSSEYLGQMITQMQNCYITDVPNDAFTLEEFILLGDPTLKIGGYPIS